MTREEAIEELKILKEDYWDDDGYGHETEQYCDTMSALDMGIEALENQKTVIEELESLLQIMIKRNNQVGHTDGWYMGSATMINIIDRRICELTNEEYKPYLERITEAELKGESDANNKTD